MQHDSTSLPAGQAIAAPAPPKSPLGYTVAEVAEILGKHPNTIYAWPHDGPLADAKRQISGVSPMGAPYGETAAEMLDRVTTAVDDRLAIALKVAAQLMPEVEERRRSRRARKDAS
jgi:hypothetical protein